MPITIRDALPQDAPGIGETIADAFSHYFAALRESPEKIARVVSACANPARFIVAADETGQIVGTLGLADAGGYPLNVNKDAVMRDFGRLKGFFTLRIMADEFYRPQAFSQGQAHVDFVGVRKAFRGQGIARQMLQYMLAHRDYALFTLDVVQGNEQVLPLYENAGFKHVRQEKEPRAWIKGFRFRYVLALRPDENDDRAPGML